MLRSIRWDEIARAVSRHRSVGRFRRAVVDLDLDRRRICLVAKRADPEKLSARAKRDRELKREIERVFAENFEVYGTRKVWRQLNCEDVTVLRRPVESARYVAQMYRQRLAEGGLLGSMSRRGNSYDDAMMESFMKTLKVEGVYPLAFENPEEVAEQLPRFIEKYNARRLHSALGYLNPIKYEEQNTRPPVKAAA